MAPSQTVMPMILDYRECSKIKSSFCDPLACNLRKLVFGKYPPRIVLLKLHHDERISD
jgi:hypothetical protein